MKEIELFGKHGIGKVAMVDDEKYEVLNQHRWRGQKGGRTIYAVTKIEGEQKFMHHLVMNTSTEQKIDHKNGNGLDNQKDNLRLCTHAENMRNRRKRDSASSKYIGVCWSKVSQKWTSEVRSNNERYNLGVFEVEEEAAYNRDLKAKELHGKFASLNFSEDELSLLHLRFGSKPMRKTRRFVPGEPVERRKKYNVVFFDSQLSFLEAEMQKTGRSVAEILRSMIDLEVSRPKMQ